MKKIITILLTAVMLVGLFAGCSNDPKTEGKPYSGQTLRVYNWGEYIDESVLEKFTEETGAKVIYDTFETNEAMYTKLKMSGSGSGYDVVIPSDYMIKRMIDEDLLAEIDTSKMDNYQYIGDNFKSLPYDPDNKYSVSYMWGTIGVLYNTTMVEEEPTGWDALWDTRYSQQIFMMNSVRDSVGVALKSLGYSLNSTSADELAEAEALLKQQKPLVLAYTLDDVRDHMIAGEGALALIYSGDAVTCMDENEDLAYAIPEEGTNLWFDAMCVLKTSKNQELAQVFINFMCREDIAASNRDYINYYTPQTQVIDSLDDEVRAEYPSDEIIAKSEVFVDLGASISTYDALWTRVLNG